MFFWREKGSETKAEEEDSEATTEVIKGVIGDFLASLINIVWMEGGGEVLTSGQQGLVLVHVPSPGIADAVVEVVASGVHAIVITAEVDNSTRSQEVNLVGQH